MCKVCDSLYSYTDSHSAYIDERKTIDFGLLGDITSKLAILGPSYFEDSKPRLMYWMSYWNKHHMDCIDDEIYSYEIKINYCPFCGRKLTED